MPNSKNTNTNQNANQNANQNTQGGTTMNGQNNFQVPQGVDPTMFFMLQMQQQSQENMMLMLQQMQNSNPNAALLQMVLNNQNNNAPKSALGQRLDDVNTFAAMITPSDADLTAAGDRAVAKAEADYNTAKAAMQSLNPQATDAQIENVLKIMGKEPLTQAQIELIRAKAEEETINRKTENFNKAITGLKAFEASYTVPVAAATAPIPAPPSQRRTFPETISDLMRANAEAKITWNKTAYNIK